MHPTQQPDPEILRELARATMPFGKYRDTRLLELPEAYLAWFERKGWPNGRLGMLMATAYEVRINGLEHLFNGLHP